MQTQYDRLAAVTLGNTESAFFYVVPHITSQYLCGDCSLAYEHARAYARWRYHLDPPQGTRSFMSFVLRLTRAT